MGRSNALQVTFEQHHLQFCGNSGGGWGGKKSFPLLKKINVSTILFVSNAPTYLKIVTKQLVGLP